MEFGEDVDLRPALAALKAWCVGDATGWTVVLDDQAPLVAAGLAEIAALFVGELTEDVPAHVDLMFRALEVAEKGLQE